MSSKNVRPDIDKLRAEIQRVGDEIEWLAGAPLPLEECKARVADGCRQLATHFTENRLRLGVFVHPNTNPQEALMEAFAISKNTTGVSTLTIEEVGPALCWAMGDSLVQRLHAEIDALDYGPPGLPMAERPARLAQLKGMLRQLEEQEEALICKAEEAGEVVFRRAEADPAVVLGYDPKGRMVDGPKNLTASLPPGIIS